jgi:DsbC/DsbD-like thiol-disulfide interchange protein
MQKIALAAIATLLLVSAPLAGETEWQEVVPGVKLRLVSAGVVKPDGTALFGLEIEMPDNTKTYWRVPGETGLPTELDLTGSRGVKSAEIVWPHPEVDTSSGYVDFAYFGNTLLPITVATDDPHGTLSISAMLGICSEIFLPAQASFTLALTDAEPDRPNGLRIKQALAEAPIDWNEGEEPIGDVQYRPEDKALAVWVDDKTVDVSTLIVATQTGTPLFGVPQKSPQEGLVLLPILTKTENSDLEGKHVQVSFMTGMGAFALSRTIGSGPASN